MNIDRYFGNLGSTVDSIIRCAEVYGTDRRAGKGGFGEPGQSERVSTGLRQTQAGCPGKSAKDLLKNYTNLQV